MRRTMNGKYDFCIARGARTRLHFLGVVYLTYYILGTHAWDAFKGGGRKGFYFHFFNVLHLTLRFCMHDPAGAVGGKEIDIYIWGCFPYQSP